MKRFAVAFVLVLAGCPNSSTSVPSTPVPSQPPPLAAPAPPPAAPRTWASAGVGSVFETVTKTHFESGTPPDSERTVVQTIEGFEGDTVKVRLEATQAGVRDDPKPPVAYPLKQELPPATAHESVTVKAGTFECDVTTETIDDMTTKTWRTKALPVPVKIETKGPGYTSTAELVRAQVK